GNFIRQFGFHLRASAKRSVQNKHINQLLDSCQGTNSQTLCQKKEIEKTKGLKFCRMVEVQYYQSFSACA
ncbi:MAG: hypothetical protein II272_05265, partial [Oscillospiraceae bacterium]|nr:hypothetical protein [Oscillospiraceae bacterium]